MLPADAARTQQMLEWFTTGSLAVIAAGLIIAGMGAPIPEDVLLLTAGALAERTGTTYFWVTALCSAAVLGGDLILFEMARRLGPALLERRLFRGLLPPERREKVEAFFERHGLSSIFIARHVAGLRAAVFTLAGMNRLPILQFVIADGLGVLVSVPLFVWLGFEFSEHLDEVERGISSVEDTLLVGAAVVLGGYAVWVVIRRWRNSRKEE